MTREGRDPRRMEGLDRRFTGPAIGGIEDQYVRRAVDGLLDRIVDLETRLAAFTTPSGVISGNLPADVRKSTDTGFGLIPAVEEIADNIGGEGVDTLAAGKVLYVSTATVESLEPGEAGANVTETRTAALIASQGALATQGSVDLATAEVTNKLAANITFAGLETIESLKPGEAGADVTGSNTAALITGQGALATKSTVGSSEIDTGAVIEGKLATDAVTAIKIKALTITAAEIKGNTITGNKIAAGAVDTSELANEAATNVKCKWGGNYTPNGHADTIGLLNNAVNELQAEVVTLGGTINKPVSGGAPES